MTFGRAAAGALYIAAAFFWVVGMLLGSMLGCEGGCFGDERDRLDTSLVLSLVGLSLATAAFVGSLLSRRVGLLVLGVHVIVFVANLVVLSGLPDSGSPWFLLVPGGLAALAGYIAVGGRQVSQPNQRS
jgi:hypothetical protein